MSAPEFRLDASHAVITGVGGGIGAELARALRASGAHVTGVDIGSKPEAELDAYIECDLRDPGSIEALPGAVETRLGPPDVLVNAAGIARESSAAAMGREDWDAVMEVNARGTFQCCQAFGRGMIERGQGKVVNFASRCGYIGYPGYASYNASKAAVVSITQTLAVEWASAGVTVNALAPGFVKTSMTEYVWSDRDRLAAINARCPMGRMAEPGEVSGAVVFLASPASDYITRAVLPVDGGMLAY